MCSVDQCGVSSRCAGIYRRRSVLAECPRVVHANRMLSGYSVRRP
jgi:hypothetical protein